MSPARRRRRTSVLVAAAAAVLAGAGVAASTTATPSAAPSSAAPAAPGVRVVHSPGVVTDDMHLQAGSCVVHWSTDGQARPDPACTPGAVDPAVTQVNVQTTICREGGYTGSVRPPASNTDRWKKTSRAAYGAAGDGVGEYDHLIPLSLGGANSTSNLWFEPGATPNRKDRTEAALWRAVCAGTLTLAEAQQRIATDWTTAAR